MEHDILLPLARSLHRLTFEARKDTQVVFSSTFRFHLDGANEPFILDHVMNRRPEIIEALCHGYDRRESAMPCGGILREAVKTDTFAAMILYDEPPRDGRKGLFVEVQPQQPSSGKGVFWRFFDWIDKSAFEVSADAFSTFRVSPRSARFKDIHADMGQNRTFSQSTRSWLRIICMSTMTSSSSATTQSLSSLLHTSPSGSRSSCSARSCSNG